MVDCTIDYARLRVAIGELFREAITREEDARLARAAEGAANAERALSGARRGGPARSLPAGYYDWSEHLFGLDDEIRLGVHLTARELQARELNGLRVLRDARAEFERDFPPCPSCGTRNRKLTVDCRSCRHRLLELKGGRR